MRHFVDLHTHSTASDGDLSPAEVVTLAERKRLAAVALTDHDTTAGVAEAAAAAEALAVRFVAGVEISAAFSSLSARRTDGALHMVGLGIDPAQPALADGLARIRRGRRERNPKMLAKLRGLGLDVRMSELLAVAGVEAEGAERVIGRLHMARLLVRKGCVRDLDEAFARYLGRGRPAYVERERFTPEEAIEAIHAAGGVAVLAHPVHLGADNAAQLERFVRWLVHHGLDGVEVYHCDHSPQQTRRYLDLARRLGLLVSGGSDFHGPAKPDVRLGRPRVPLAAVEQLLAKLGA